MLIIFKLFYLFKLSWKCVAPHSKDNNINLQFKENQWYRIEYYGFTSRRIAAVWQRKLTVWLDAGAKIHEEILQAWHSHEDDSIVLLWFTNTVVDFKYFYICFCDFHWQYFFSHLVYLDYQFHYLHSFLCTPFYSDLLPFCLSLKSTDS